MAWVLFATLTVMVVLKPAESAICRGSKAPCDDGSCVYYHYFCDGVPHCPDNSDEANCGDCPPGEKPCPGCDFCLYADLFCNDIPDDCPGNADETNCNFPIVPVICGCNQQTQQECDDGQCVATNQWCNGGPPDCDDGSDENLANCGPVEECMKCNGATSLSQCTTVTCQPSQKFCHWQDVWTPNGWILNSGCVAACPEGGSSGHRGNHDSGIGVYKGCCDYNGCA